MARADLVVSLVETGISGDLLRFKKTAEAIAEEARSMHHYHLAEKLSSLISNTSSESRGTSLPELQNAFYELPTQRKFSDLILDDIILNQCIEIIEEHHRRDLLRSYNLEPRHKIILSGPPGNGKTTLAEAISTHLMVPLFVVKYEGIISRYLGETAQQLDKLFDYIKTRRCVLFFDEFDAISKEREDENDNGEIKRVVNSLLKQIDMLPSHVVVIGATNHESMLDRAIWRRFQIQINMPKPSKKMAEKWFDSFTDKIGHTLGYASSTLADKLYGLSFAELEEFALDVQRRYVLGLPESEKNIKKIVNSRLSYWTSRYKDSF
jgi:SpoVK/Ycf46/Vps4 family AAA+-type ATPase